MSASNTFDELYKKLNKRQKEAVDTIEGPVMVIAGPGTGKTQILALRIASILLKTDTPPDAILAISFTESAAAEMRSRVVSLVGEAGYRVRIHTFHSLCNELIQHYPEEFSQFAGASPISEVERSRAIAEILETGSYQIIRPSGDPTHYVRAIGNGIHIVKRENISPDVYADIITQEEKEFLSRDDTYHTSGTYKGKMKGFAYDIQKKIDKNKELCEVYHAYQLYLQKNHFYDFDDMIMEVIRVWKERKDFLRSIQERFLYILIDEHQDTNNAQNAIIEAVCSFDKQPNLFLVGDEKQAIFRFQGASFENFMRMKEAYPDMKLIVLEDNYRSTQIILDASHGLGERIVKDPARLRARVKYDKAPIQITIYENDNQEINAIATSIKEKIEAGTKPENIAVLYRENKDALAISRALEQSGIPFVIESDQDIFSDYMIRGLLALARMVDDPLEDEMVAYVLHMSPMGIHPLDAYAIIRYARKYAIPILSYLKRLTEGLYDDEYENRDSVVFLYRRVSQWIRVRQKTSPLLLLDVIARESGILGLTGTNRDRNSWQAVKRVYGELEQVYERHTEYTFHDIVLYLEYMRSQGLSIRGGALYARPDAVRCMTAHRAKGLEFNCVYIVRAYDGHWGNKRVAELLPIVSGIYGSRASSYAYTDEDRRLFYVAMTRAKKEVYISYARLDAEGRERLPSEYIADIRDDMCSRSRVPDTTAYELNTSLKIVPQKNTTWYEQTKHITRELLHEKGLSVTALNNYLACPWRYFYVNLLGIPQVQKLHQIYGIAIHNALRDTAHRARTLSDSSALAAYACDQFTAHLHKKPIPSYEYQRWLERGKKSLSIFVPTFYTDITEMIHTELRIENIPITENVSLRGVIDRMDKTKDGTIRVIDYKTGKHKSVAQIEGKTKSSDGSIFRQLVFYKLLLDVYEKGKYQMERGVIAFVEPDEKGVCYAHEFTITKDHTKELKEIIQKSISEIESLSFWEKHCDDSECPYCTMRFMMRDTESGNE